MATTDTFEPLNQSKRRAAHSLQGDVWNSLEALEEHDGSIEHADSFERRVSLGDEGERERKLESRQFTQLHFRHCDGMKNGTHRRHDQSAGLCLNDRRMRLLPVAEFAAEASSS